MRRALLTILSMFALPLRAQTADEIVSKYVKTIGGMDKIAAVKSFRRTEKYTGGGGFEARVLEEKRRPDLIRQEFSIQGMVGVTAYDGKNGWKIEPWQGKKDPEPLGEEERKSIIEDSDFDGPLVNYQAKGSPFKQKVTYEKVEVNLPLSDSRFVEPAVVSKTPVAVPDASNVQPKKAEEKKPPETEPKKPPMAMPLTRGFAAPSPEGEGAEFESLLPREKVAEGRMRGQEER